MAARFPASATGSAGHGRPGAVADGVSLGAPGGRSGALPPALLTSGVAVTGCEGSDVGGDRGAVAAGSAGLAAGPVVGVGWAVASGPFATGPVATAATPGAVVVAGTAVPTGVAATAGSG